MKPDIHLYTASTMNGWKPVIFLEEAKIPYELTHIDFDQNEQKSDWYLKINPMVGFQRLSIKAMRTLQFLNRVRFCGIWPRNTIDFFLMTPRNVQKRCSG